MYGKKFVAFFSLDGIKKHHELFPTPNTSYIDLYFTYSDTWSITAFGRNFINAMLNTQPALEIVEIYIFLSKYILYKLFTANSLMHIYQSMYTRGHKCFTWSCMHFKKSIRRNEKNGKAFVSPCVYNIYMYVSFQLLKSLSDETLAKRTGARSKSNSGQWNTTIVRWHIIREIIVCLEFRIVFNHFWDTFIFS